MMLLSAFADNDQTDIRIICMWELDWLDNARRKNGAMLITEIPANAVPIRSGLFEAVPRNIIVLPILFEDRVKAVIELASLSVHGVAPFVPWSS